MNAAVRQTIETLEDSLSLRRRDFHAHPETGWLEVRTASLVARELENLGWRVSAGASVVSAGARMGVPGPEELEAAYIRALENGADPVWAEKVRGGFTGVVGVLDTGRPGPVLACRFDLDALNILESDSSAHRPAAEGFASRETGVMHACGHDGHAALGLAVAEALSRLKDKLDLRGRVKLVFQPAEEGVRGAKAMVAAGVLDDADYLLSGHLISTLPLGVLVCAANGFLATTKFDVCFRGLSSHAGGAPNEGRNALLAACTATLALHALPRHKDGDSRVNVGTLVSRSDRNIIPDAALIKVEVRGATTKINEFMREGAVRTVKAAAAMHDVSCEIEWMGEAPCCRADDDFAARIGAAASSVAAFREIRRSSEASSGSEDVTFMMEAVQRRGGKATFVNFGAKAGTGHHTRTFDIDERALAPAAELFVVAAADLLGPAGE